MSAGTSFHCMNCNSTASEHTRLRDEIEHLKTALEDAQLQRKRKIEYDAIAEKINTLPSRDELQRYASALRPLFIV